MKKVLTILFLASFALLSCNKESVNGGEETAPGALSIDFDIRSVASPEVKGVKTAWEDGDVIYVFFRTSATPAANEKKYLKIHFDGSSSKWVVDRWNGDLDTEVSTYDPVALSAIYCPNDKVGGTFNIIYAGERSSYTIRFYDALGTDGNDNLFYSHYLYAENVAYTIVGGVINATINMAPFLGSGSSEAVQFCIQNDRDGNTIPASEARYYKLSQNISANVIFCTPTTYQRSGTSAGTFGHAMGTYDQSMSAYYQDGICFSMMVVTNNYDYVFTLVDSKNGKTYTYSVNAALTRNAYKLPDLNAKDAGDNYKWVEVTP